MRKVGELSTLLSFDECPPTVILRALSRCHRRVGRVLTPLASVGFEPPLIGAALTTRPRCRDLAVGLHPPQPLQDTFLGHPEAGGQLPRTPGSADEESQDVRTPVSAGRGRALVAKRKRRLAVVAIGSREMPACPASVATLLEEADAGHARQVAGCGEGIATGEGAVLLVRDR